MDELPIRSIRPTPVFYKAHTPDFDHFNLKVNDWPANLLSWFHNNNKGHRISSA